MNRLTKSVALPLTVALNALALLWMVGQPIAAERGAPSATQVVMVQAATSDAGHFISTRRLLTFPSLSLKHCRGLLCRSRNG